MSDSNGFSWLEDYSWNWFSEQLIAEGFDIDPFAEGYDHLCPDVRDFATGYFDGAEMYYNDPHTLDYFLRPRTKQPTKQMSNREKLLATWTGIRDDSVYWDGKEMRSIYDDPPEPAPRQRVKVAAKTIQDKPPEPAPFRQRQKVTARAMVEPNNNLQAIETHYRGYRFRSRLEARWAVFFDAAGIEWQYEVEGYVLNGENYLPDFWLPELQTFAEVKPTEEKYKKGLPLMKLLTSQSGYDGIFLVDAPNVAQSYQMWLCRPQYEQPVPTNWWRCSLCGSLHHKHPQYFKCHSLPQEVQLISERHNNQTAVRIEHVNYALRQAQGARFEHGETFKPTAYSTTTKQRSVYIAGSVLEDEENDSGWNGAKIRKWRTELESLPNKLLRYGGPTLAEEHGYYTEALAMECLEEVQGSDILFAWIDMADTIGTAVEIGAASIAKKPVFVAFANQELSRRFYFVEQLANLAIIAPSAKVAWEVFKRWWVGQQVS